MSGGAYNYFYYKFQNFIEDLEINTKNRQKLIPILEELKKVLHNIEWADSGDLSNDVAERSIKKFFNFIKGR